MKKLWKFWKRWNKQYKMKQNMEERRKQQEKNGAKKSLHEEYKAQIGNIKDKKNYAEDTLR